MHKKLLIYMIFLECQEIYKDVRSLDQADYEDMVSLIENSKMYKYHLTKDYFNSLKNKHKDNIKNLLGASSSNSSSFFREFIMPYTKMLSDILDSIMNRKYDNAMIKLILKTKIDETDQISSSSIASVYASQTISEILDLLYNGKHINKEEWIKKTNNELRLIKCKFLTTIFLFLEKNQKDDEIFLLKCWEISYLKNIRLAYNKYFTHYNSLKQNAEGISFSLFLKKFNFFSIINEIISKELIKENSNLLAKRLPVGYYKNFKSDKNPFYMLVSHKGSSYNKISRKSFKNPAFEDVDMILDQKADGILSTCKHELDLKFIENILVSTHGKEEFNFFIGLFQYYAESQLVYIVYLYRKENLTLKIADVFKKVDCILKYYKSRNDITNEFVRDLQKDEDKNKDKHFQTINSLRDYYFLEREGCIKIPESECLKLSCNHIIGKELLEEFLRFAKMKCFFCNIEVKIVGYLKIDLYLKRDD